MNALGTNFWRLWSSSALSNLADGILKVILPLIAARLTGSPSQVAGVTLALTLPWLLFALPAGALADRWDRRRTMVGANLARAVLMSALAVSFALDATSIWLLYVVAFLVGTTETAYDTSAQSILPQLVPRALLPRANGRLFAAELTANQFVGPPLGGLLLVVGTALAFAVPAAMWVAAVGVLLLLRGRFRVERVERTTMRADVVEGLRFLWRQKLLRLLAVMVGLSNFTSNAAWAILVLYAVGPGSAVGLSEPGYGAMLAVVAVGATIGSLLAERVERWIGRTATLTVSCLTMTLLVGSPALTTDVLALGIAVFVGGIGVALWNVITVSLRQRVTPDRLLGRVSSGYRLIAWGTMPLGALAGGALAEWLGLRAVFAIAGIVTLLLTGLMLPVRRLLHDLDATEQGAPAPVHETADTSEPSPAPMP